MRWIPLLFILSTAIISKSYISRTITDFYDRRFYLSGLLYVVFLGTILFTPISFDGTGVYIMPLGLGSVNLYKLDILELGFVENIILTLPLGFLIQRFCPRISLFSITLLGFLIGSGIETMQYYLSHVFLINRTSDINDVIANAMGIVVGATLMVVYGCIVDNSKSIPKNIEEK